MARRFVNRILAGSLQLAIVLAAAGWARASAVEPRETQLRWNTLNLRVAVSSSLVQEQSTGIKSGSDIRGAILRSLRTWQTATNIDFEVVDSDLLNASAAGVKGDGISLITIAPSSQNLQFFAKDGEGTPAKTRVFFDRRGFITEADIVLNPTQPFSTDGSLGTYDLQATITHEIGHMLGLTHSSVFGSSMYEKIAKNGFAGSAADFGRTLSAIDIASIRTLYGAEPESDCCGSIRGRISGPADKSYLIWAENADTGRVAAVTERSPAGGFRLDGLEKGIYRIFAQGAADAGREIGNATVETGESPSLAGSGVLNRIDFSVRLIGLNSQLSRLPVSLNSGKTLRVFLGGKNLNSASIRIGSTSRFLSVNNSSVADQDFGDKISALSFELTVDPETPAGEYTIYVESEAGERQFLVGAISIER